MKAKMFFLGLIGMTLIDMFGAWDSKLIAQTIVDPYIRSNGTGVKGHVKTYNPIRR